MNEPRHVFGPVLSSRLGRSLGLDPLGARICSFDCLYCEAGATQSLTIRRHPYVPADVVLAELTDWKAAGHEPPEALTLGGMGEPCLSSECGRIIAGAKRLFPQVPVAVLTNASLLTNPEARADVAAADMVLPSMDTLVEREFHRLNRPHADLRLDDIRQGLLTFRAGYPGLIFLEILLVDGINDSEANLSALRAFCRELKPDRVDVVTMTRPGAHGGAAPVNAATLARFRRVLGGAEDSPRPDRNASAKDSGADLPIALARSIEASLARRPQTANGLAAALGAPLARVDGALEEMERAGHLRRHAMGTEVFFLPVRK
jgi:wyosine [tRNA(Phe)-imidazoG37] synthetase (radical SAM superfamily)